MTKDEAYALAEELGYEILNVRRIRLEPNYIAVEIVDRDADGKLTRAGDDVAWHEEIHPYAEASA